MKIACYRFKILIAHNEIPKSGLDVFAEKLERCELVISESRGSPFPSRETLLNDIKGVDAVMWFGHMHVDREMIDAAGEL
ncbi:hypothetical protein J6590_018481 [Homalodisca vitripennis]|nr:hypothetical protein J6590_018481 [Homalodisca vitripennis]